MEVFNLDALLLHGVTLAQCHGVVLEGLVVNSDTIRSTDCILTAIALADGILLLIVSSEIKFEFVDDFACLFGKSVLTYKREHGAFYRCERRGEMEHYTLFATFKFLFLVRGAEHTQEHAVNTDRGLYDIGSIALVEFGVEILDFLAGELLMLRKIEISA